jgi:hypothetical protein
MAIDTSSIKSICFKSITSIGDNMVTIVKAAPSLGERFGTGLGQGLQLLAQQKLNQIAQRQQAHSLESLGFTPQESSSLALLDPMLQKEFLKQKLAAPSQEAFAQSLSELLGQPQEAQAPMTATQEAAQAQKPRLTEKQATTLAKLGLQKQAMAQKERTEAFKATKAERKEIIDKARTARQNLHDLDRMEELEKEGKLDTPGYMELLKRTGFDLPALMSPGSEEFNKIAANFIRDAKSIYGSRVSNFEIEQFLKTIPSLSMSPEGRKRVIANLKNIARGNLEYNNALKDIIAENKGIPPLDINEQIDDRIEKKLDALSKKFREDLAKPVPKGQNKLITALQAGLGSLAGGAGSLAKGVVNPVSLLKTLA